MPDKLPACSRIVIKFRNQNKITNLLSGFSVTKLFFSVHPQRITELARIASTTDPGYHAPDFLLYHVLDCKPSECVKLLQELRDDERIELAYIDNGLTGPPSVSGLSPLTCSQRYLKAAPHGIDAEFAWTFKGGDGSSNVKLIDIERGWIAEHEDFIIHELPQTGINDLYFREHGAATLGVILMQDNETGGTGITPKAKAYIISQWRPDGSFNTGDAIMTALDHLEYGDILLLEAQCLNAFTGTKLWPIETQEACYQAIRLATALGITVIEAAGNGHEGMKGNDLDEYIDFNGKKILNRNGKHFRDSGAIMVGAATSDVPHERIDFSNYGNRIDCYAWGEKVVTAGNYPGSSGAAVNLYTSSFNGTSSAAAIIAGAALAMQSIAAVNQHQRLSPQTIRCFLAGGEYGTPSANGQANDKIGVMPDLRKILPSIYGAAVSSFWLH